MPNPPLGRLLSVLFLASFARVSGQEAPQKPPEPAPDVLWLRFLPGSQPYQDEELAKLLQPWIEPERVKVQKGQDLRPLLELRCGGARPGVVSTLEAWNPKVKNAVAMEDAEIELPPCPFWTQRISVSVPSGGSVYSMMKVHMGTAGDDSLKEVERLNPKTTLKHVKAGQKITLPYSTRVRAYSLRSDTYGAGAQKALASFPGQVDATLEKAANYQMIPAVTKERDCPTPADSRGSHAWPFDRPALLKVLKKNDSFSRKAERTRTAALVVVPDTGIARKEARLFFRLGIPKAKDLPLRPGEVGEDLVLSGYPEADREYEYYDHGTRVASLAQGGPAESDGKGGLADALRQRLRLKVFGIVKRRDGSPKPAFEVHDQAISDAVYAAGEEKGVAAAIVNLSVSSGRMSGALRQTLELSRTLIVVAAGNSATNLDHEDSKTYPAWYVKDIPKLMIVVGAHDEQGRIAPFSNFGEGVVDLAAPGCRVPGLVPDGGSSPASGTSFAAPLVSFAGALLAYEGLRQHELKNRLVASADRTGEESWRGKVARGRLNLERALDLYSDHVVLKTGARYVGRLLSPPSHLRSEHGLTSWERCKRISALPGTDKFEVYVEEQGGTLSYKTELLEDMSLKIAQDGGKVVPFKLAQVQDFVPAQLQRSPK